LVPPRHGEGDQPTAGGGGAERAAAPPPSVPLCETAKRIALAAVAGAHGVKGEVRLKLFGEGVAGLARHAAMFIGGTERRLLGVRDAGKGAVARFEGIDDRSAAESLRGALVEIDRDSLPPLGAGEYYHADLIGLHCVDRSGRPVGTVAAVENFGAGDLLDVALEGGRRSLIPFRDGIADLEDDRIVLDPAFLA